MKHQMKLSKEAFDMIKSGKKTVEVRLYDEKRQKIKVDDEIEFSLNNNPEEKITVKVRNLSRFKTFRELYSSFDSHLFGYPKEISLDNKLREIKKHYSDELEAKYGVLAIHIGLIN